MQNISLFLLCIIFIYAASRAAVVDPGAMSIRKYIYYNFAFFFGLISTIYIIDFDYIKLNSNNFWVAFSVITDEKVALMAIIALLGLISLELGLISSRSSKILIRRITERSTKRYFKMIVAVSLLSSLLTYAHIYLSGGVIQAILTAEMLRAHGADLPLGQLSKFQPLVVIGSLLLMPFKTKINYFFVFTSFLYLTLELSRTNIAIYLFSFYLIWLNSRNKFSLIALIVPVALAIVMAFAGNAVTDILRGEDFSLPITPYSQIISQFSPTSSNLLNINEFVEINGYGYFSDVRSLIPEAAIGMNKTWKTWQALTEMYLGGFYSVGIPIDLLSYGYSQLGFLGVFILCLAYGFFFGNLAKRFRQISKVSKYSKYYIPLEIIVCLFAAHILGWGSMDSTVVSGTMKYWIFLLIFYATLSRTQKHG
jgi:hypothetical protein